MFIKYNYEVLRTFYLHYKWLQDVTIMHEHIGKDYGHLKEDEFVRFSTFTIGSKYYDYTNDEMLLSEITKKLVKGKYLKLINTKKGYLKS